MHIFYYYMFVCNVRFVTEKSFADVHRVDGMRGVYIASVFFNGTFDSSQQMSLISFDKGALHGRWVKQAFTSGGRDKILDRVRVWQQ